MNERQLGIQEITLLSVAEFNNNEDLIPPLKEGWWLRSPSDYFPFVGIVKDHKVLGSIHVCSPCGVRPVLKMNCTGKRAGDKIEIAGRDWTVLRDGSVISNEIAGVARFNKKSIRRDSTDFERSTLRKKLKKWIKNEIKTHK